MKRLLLIITPCVLLGFASCGEKEDCVGGPLEVHCTAIYDPVCGCDGKTYSNGCVASTKGIYETKKGACK